MSYRGTPSQTVSSIIGDLERGKMLEFLINLFLLLFIIAVFIGIMAFLLHYSRKKHLAFLKSWEALAPQVEFQFEMRNQNPCLVGKIKQYNCRIYLNFISSGEHSTAVINFEVDLPESLQLGLSIGPQGKHIPFMKFLSREELELDDEIFDQHFFVQGRDTVAVNQFLTLERKLAIYQAKHYITPTNLYISDTLIQGRAVQSIAGAHQIILVMKQLVAIANTFYDKEPEEIVWESVDNA